MHVVRTRLMRKLFFLLPGLLLCFTSSANVFRFTHLDTRQGLSQNTVNCVLRDSEGFIWIGTQNGLNRYDGYTFTHFRYSRSDSASIADNFVLNLAEGAQGLIWVGTRNGVCAYDKSSGRFTRIYTEPGDRLKEHMSVQQLLQLPGGKIVYHQSGRGWNELRKEGGTFRAIPLQLKAYFIAADAQRAAAAGKNGVHLLGDDLATAQQLDNDTSLVNTARLCFKENSLYTGSGKKLFRSVIARPGLRTLVAEFPQDIAHLRCDRSGRLWIGTLAGLFVLGSDGIVRQVRADARDPHALSSERITSLYEDQQGLIWIGTSDQGLNVYDPSQERWELFAQSSSPALKGSSVWSMLEAPGCLLAGTSAGLEVLAEKNAPQWTKTLPSEPYTTALCFDKTGKLWIGTRSKGLFIVDTASGETRHYDESDERFGTSTVFHLHLARDGSLWCSTIKGLAHFSNAGEYVMYRRDHPTWKMGGNYVISTHEDRGGLIWAAHTGGLSRFDPVSQTFADYKARQRDSSSLSYSMCSFLLEDSKQRFWIATLGGGLNLMDRAQGKFKAFGTAAGLPDEVVYTVLEDARGRLWMGTDAGLACFDPGSGQARTFTQKDGLPVNEFVQNAAYRSPRGLLYFGTTDGLIRFDPAAIELDASGAQPVLSGLLVNYEARPHRPGEALQLGYEERNVSFAFTAVDYRNQEKLVYSYRLEGFDEEWITPPPGLRNAAYTNLPYGDYVFRLRFRNGGGGWSEKELAVPVHLPPPFWLTGWFITLLVIVALLVVAAAVWLYSRYRFRRKMRALEMERKIHLERERISRDLHDNIGAQITYFVSTLDFLSFRLDQQSLEQNRHLLGELGNNARNTMQQLRETIWAINKEQFTAEEFVQRLRSYLGRQTSSAGIAHDFQFEGDAQAWLQPGQVLNLFRIVQEAVNNALKHAGAKSIGVRLQLDGKKLSLSIRDDGAGFSGQESPEGHFGLSNMKQRAEELGGKLLITSVRGEGTVIAAEIPL